MNLRFHRDEDSGLPHIYGHGITELEVEQILRNKGHVIDGEADSTIKIGQTDAGRYLKVIYSKDRIGDGIFVITTYDLKNKSKRTFRRKRRRKGI